MNYNISASYFQGYGFLNKVQNVRSKSMEKLSSGYRINYASDDSAGSSMSSIMRSQIRGLEQATRNSDDAINMLNSADSGLGQIVSILQRIRELGVQAVNDTNTPDDRLAIQQEVDQLLSEVDRIAKTTEYNNIKLLNNTPEASNLGRGLAYLVGTGNITPDGTLSETYNIWQMLDPATGGANATASAYRTQEVTHITTTSCEKINEYKLFRYGFSSYYSGDIYDSAGNKLGTVPKTTAAAVLDPSASTILPENKVPYPTLPAPKKEEKTLTTYTAPSTTPIKTETKIENEKNIGTVQSSSSAVYGKDASGNLIPLTYSIYTADRKTTESYTEYSDFNDITKAVHINFEKYNAPGGFTNADLYGTGFNSTCATCSNHYSIKFVQGTTSQIKAYGRNHTLEIGIDVLPPGATGADLAKLVVDSVDKFPSDDLSTHHTQYATDGATLYIFDRRGLDHLNKHYSKLSDTFAAISYEDTLTKVQTNTPFKIQAGANSYEVVNISLPFISTKELGIQNIDLRDGTSASDAITLLDTASEYISLERNKIGTYRNRLEHVSNIDESSSLATTESESKIHDSDFSDEVINLTKAQILEEYGVNSVAEINKMIENVLQFIK